jgi:hypothetical protein
VKVTVQVRRAVSDASGLMRVDLVLGGYEKGKGAVGRRGTFVNRWVRGWEET